MRVRCYVPPEQWDRPMVQISGREAHHLVHVLRVTSGDSILCFDGKGNEAKGQVTRVGRHGLTMGLTERHAVTLPSWTVTLGVAIPKRGKLDSIVDQATQLGVHRIIPLLTQRTEIRFSLDSSDRKQTRLSQIVIEAAKQSGVSHCPTIDPVTSWTDLLASLKNFDLVLLFTVEGPHEELSSVFGTGVPSRVLLLIGPEGDFSPEEVHAAKGMGAHVASLGQLVLRCETAVVVALGLVRFLLHQQKEKEGKEL